MRFPEIFGGHEEVSQIGWIREQQTKDRQNLQLAREAKRRFDKSGMSGLIRDLLKKTPELKFRESLGIIRDSYYSGEGVYTCEVILEDVPQYHDDPMTKVFIRTVMSPDGTIRFNGDQEKGSSIVPEHMYKNNKSVLRDALKKAYENPQREIRPPHEFNDYMYADMA